MRFWVSASLALLCAAVACAQATAATQTKPGTHRKFNELTLAGLRPGRDKTAKAIQLFGKPDIQSPDKRSLSWVFEDAGGAFYLNLDTDKMEVVQFIRVSHDNGPSGVNLPKRHPPDAYHSVDFESAKSVPGTSFCTRLDHSVKTMALPSSYCSPTEVNLSVTL